MVTFEEWAETQGGNIDITNQFQYESWKAGQESLRQLVEKMREALVNSADLLSECGYGEASDDCLAFITEADKFLGKGE